MVLELFFVVVVPLGIVHRIHNWKKYSKSQPFSLFFSFFIISHDIDANYICLRRQCRLQFYCIFSLLSVLMKCTRCILCVCGRPTNSHSVFVRENRCRLFIAATLFTTFDLVSLGYCVGPISHFTSNRKIFKGNLLSQINEVSLWTVLCESRSQFTDNLRANWIEWHKRPSNQAWRQIDGLMAKIQFDSRWVSTSEQEEHFYDLRKWYAHCPRPIAKWCCTWTGSFGESTIELETHKMILQFNEFFSFEEPHPS